MTEHPPLARALVAEALGSALLVAVVVGSGIMAQQLSGGNAAVALLANTVATGAGLLALLWMLGPVSGAHFNPVVSLVHGLEGALPWARAVAYVPAQVAGAVCGTALAHAMFGRTLFTLSTHLRSSTGEVLAEGVATFGLLATIWGVSRQNPKKVPMAVAAYIVAAYWFTSSTSFANPAVTLARCLTDTFSGIAPASVPAFIAAQVVGGTVATLLFRWLVPKAS